tara:strand:+ start:606 stop:1319 length:714 start_codon:yes stop_codon:yes gene_type:complete
MSATNQIKYSSTPNEPSSLSLKKVSFCWPNGIKALDQCSFSITNNGLWMIVGKNGSGKSTLFKLINGMIKAESGEIVCSFKPSLMFQNPDHQLLLPTCGSDLLLSLPRGLTNDQREIAIQNSLDQVGMSGMEDRPIHTLSGGQKQRLSLAGALASGANLLLLDEPTALLDPSSQKSVLEIVRQLCSRSENPITAIWITHRLDELKYCEAAATMEKGRVGDWFSGNDLFYRLKQLAGR